MIFNKYLVKYKLFKNDIRSIFLYLFASLIPIIVNLSINPWIAINMSPIDYTIVGYYTSFNLLFTPLITFSFSSYYVKKYFEVEINERKKIKVVVIKSLIYSSFILTTLSLSIIYIYHIYFNYQSTIPFSPYALLSLFSIPLTGIYAFQLVELKMEKNAKKYFYLAISYGLISAFLTFTLIVWIKLGALGKFYSLLIANFLFYVFLIIKNKDILASKFDYNIFKNILMFCFPLTLAAMLEFFVSGIDKVILERNRDVIELGFYIVGFQMAGYLGFFSTSIDDTFQPDLYKCVIEKKWNRYFKIVLLKLFLISVFVLIFIILAPHIIDILTAGRYVQSSTYARIISLTAISKSIFYAISVITIAMGFTYITLFNRILSSIASIYLITIMINSYGFIGASWSLVLMYLLMALINLLLLILFLKFKKQ